MKLAFVLTGYSVNSAKGMKLGAVLKFFLIFNFNLSCKVTYCPDNIIKKRKDNKNLGNGRNFLIKKLQRHVSIKMFSSFFFFPSLLNVLTKLVSFPN